jgi:flagellar protein FliS
MSSNPYASHLETEVLSASPVELVQMIYRAAIDSMNAARIHLSAGEIAARSAAATRAMNLVAELAQSLDPNQGAIAADLSDLYGYILAKIQEGNFRQHDAPFEEAVRLLATLLDGWETIGEAPAQGYSKAADAEAGVPLAPLSLTA